MTTVNVQPQMTIYELEEVLSTYIKERWKELFTY